MFLVHATNSAFASDAPDLPLAPVYFTNAIPFPKNPVDIANKTICMLGLCDSAYNEFKRN